MELSSTFIFYHHISQLSCSPNNSGYSLYYHVLPTQNVSHSDSMPMFDAVIQLPERGSTEYYVFAGRKFAIMENETKGPDRLKESPKDIRSYCPILSKTGWGSVDAAIPVPGSPSEFYFFHGDHYIRATLDKDLQNTEGNIKDFKKWKGLVRAGFHTVDAGAVSDNNHDHMYFFSGTRCLKYSWSDDKVIKEPTAITDTWPALKEVGFERVDAIFPSGDQKDIWYVFRGDQYVRIKWNPGGGNATLEAGPFSIAEQFWSFREWP